MLKPLVFFLSLLHFSLSAQEKPNIIFILADDMGYGDMTHAGGKIPTPNCDRLAAEGMRFLDAHTSSSVCTPTRYGILTGRYNWRSRLKKGVVLGLQSEPLIPASRETVAGFLQRQGYHSEMIGKWHLGIGWQLLAKGEVRKPERIINKKVKATSAKKEASASRLGWDVDYSKSFIGPIANGFDHFFGIAASLDMPPYVYLENDKALAVPTVQSSKWGRAGAAAADFRADHCLMTFAGKTREFIRQQAKKKEQPFFLYLPLTSPHTPIVPSEKWQGKSGFGSYGDFLMETDWVVGEVLAELDAQGLSENTIVIFTADNGCSPRARIEKLKELGHKVNGDWRGQKADIYEGGHRVPFLMRWPAKVKGKTLSNATICTTDFFATAADAVGALDEISEDTAEDSYSFLQEAQQTGTTKRQTVVHHSIDGFFAIRRGKWKLALCPGSGGWGYPSPKKHKKELQKLPPFQLFDLEADPMETTNLASQNAEIVKSLVDQLAKEIHAGRSTPGAEQTNDGAIPFNETILGNFSQLKN